MAAPAAYALFPIAELEAAWERVEANDGCAGVDGVSVEQFAGNLERNLAKLAGEAYQPLPLLRIYVEKQPGSGKLRRLLVPAVRDRILQTVVSRRLSRSLEGEFLEASYAYRPGRSVDQAVARVQQLHHLGFSHIVDADIHAFFDQVRHDLILDRIAAEEIDPPILGLIRDWVRAEYWDGHRVRRLERGIAQGSPLSPFLANLFLHELDCEVEKSGNHLVRYADDFLVLCPSREAAEAALITVREQLAKLGLRLNDAKTRLTDFNAGFLYLGVYFLGERAWIPWKYKREQGRILHIAPPMPAVLLARYRRPPVRSTMQAALERASVYTASPRPRRAAGGFVSYLYLTEQGSTLRKSADRFLVERDGQVLLDLPYHKLEQVLVFGNVQITTQALGELLEKGIRVSLLSQNGRYRGSLATPLGKNVPLRMAQFTAFQNAERSVEYSRAVLSAKISNSVAVLDRYNQRQPAGPEFDAERQTLAEAGEALAGASALAAMLGIEGTAARAYFDALMKFNRSPFTWQGRNRRPPKDPLNALLSLMYTFVLQEIGGLLESFGLDPYIGFLHQPDYGRPSLALDLLEVFRAPVADRLVLTLVNRAIFSAQDFQESSTDGVTLHTDGLRTFVEHYEQWMRKGGPNKTSLRVAMRREVERFSAAVLKGTTWEVYRFPEEVECDTLSVTI